jgi:hypothetical protein
MPISGSGQQAKVHKRQTFLPLKAESGKVCLPISSSMAFLPPSNLGYAELNWANGGKVCLFFLFCFHCSQQVTFFYSAHRNSVLV